MSRAVVIFARTPEQEAAAKQFPVARAAILFRSMLSAWVRAASQANATAIVASAMPSAPLPHIEQRGATFGERLANCAEAAFALGYDAVVITGIDVAPPHDLEEAFRSIEAGQPVIAPARDGGVNLIGLFEPSRDLLCRFRPRNGMIAALCREYFGSVRELPIASDIDSLSDFYRALGEQRPQAAALRWTPVPSLTAAASISRAPPIAA